MENKKKKQQKILVETLHCEWCGNSKCWYTSYKNKNGCLSLICQNCALSNRNLEEIIRSLK